MYTGVDPEQKVFNNNGEQRQASQGQVTQGQVTQVTQLGGRETLSGSYRNTWEAIGTLL